jgi:outer membrane protein OmpA-like peptidoglycan-associated protein
VKLLSARRYILVSLALSTLSAGCSTGFRPSTAYLKTTEGRVDFSNERNHVHLEVAEGQAATVSQTKTGALDVGVPKDNAGAMRMRVRERFASVSPGTDFTTSATGKRTAVAVEQGTLAVRSRSGCEVVDAGAQKTIEATSSSETVAPIEEIRFPAIHYGFKSARPLVRDVSVLDCVAALLGDYPDARVAIEGHSDGVGTKRFNLHLSNRRAEGVRRALVANGIEPSRLEVKGYGWSQPVAANSTKDGRERNRRVEFKVIPGPGGSQKSSWRTSSGD